MKTEKWKERKGGGGGVAEWQKARKDVTSNFHMHLCLFMSVCYTFFGGGSGCCETWM